MDTSYITLGFGAAIGIAAAAPLLRPSTSTPPPYISYMKDFAIQRGRFLRELFVWLGVLLVVGFLRVNIWNEPIDLMFPEYASYNIMGTVNTAPAKPTPAPKVILKP